MSPTISIVSFIEPNQSRALAFAATGTISAMAFPNRITRIGFRVCCICLSNAKQSALNSEMSISFIGSQSNWTIVINDGQLEIKRSPWRNPIRQIPRLKGALITGHLRYA